MKKLTEGMRKCLGKLADGRWHWAVNTASANSLVRRGLAEKSKRGAWWEWKITGTGRKALEAQR